MARPRAVFRRGFRTTLCILLEADRRIAAWYSGAERIYGYRAAEAIGQDVSLLYPADDSLRANWTKN